MMLLLATGAITIEDIANAWPVIPIILLLLILEEMLKAAFVSLGWIKNEDEK